MASLGPAKLAFFKADFSSFLVNKKRMRQKIEILREENTYRFYYRGKIGPFSTSTAL